MNQCDFHSWCSLSRLFPTFGIWGEKRGLSILIPSCQHRPTFPSAVPSAWNSLSPTGGCLHKCHPPRDQDSTGRCSCPPASGSPLLHHVSSRPLHLPVHLLLSHYCVFCPDKRSSLRAFGRTPMPVIPLVSAGVQCIGLFNDIGPRVQTTTCSWLLTFQKWRHGTSLVLQWLGIRLPMQGTWV